MSSVAPYESMGIRCKLGGKMHASKSPPFIFTQVQINIYIYIFMLLSGIMVRGMQNPGFYTASKKEWEKEFLAPGV